jgi:hypothetical protein
MSIMWSQPAIFNVLDPWYEISPGVFVGMVPGQGSPVGQFAVQNRQALQAIINLAQASNDQSGPYYGALIVFPGHSGPATQGGTGEDAGGEYLIQAPGDGTAAIPITINWPLRFLGTGNAKLTYFIPPDDPDFLPGDMFSVETSGTGEGTNIGGMTFEDLLFHYPAITTSDTIPIPQWAAIHTVLAGVENFRIVRCTFDDCPIAIWFEQALDCSILQCFINYSANAGFGLILRNGQNMGDTNSAKQIFVTDYDAARYAQWKKRLTRLKVSGCVTCGKKYPPRLRHLLDFDHSPDLVKRFGAKRFNIANGAMRSNRAVALELRKCRLRCKSCHQGVTRARRKRQAKKAA